MILEWDNDWSLVTPIGTLPFNALASNGTTPVGYYLLDPARCSAGTAPRITRSDIPQADGEIIHRKFKAGYVIELNVQLWEKSGDEGKPACGGTLREMADLLSLHLNSIENDDGRLIWTPGEFPAGSPVGQRMLDKIRSLGPSGSGASSFVSVTTEKDSEDPLTILTFAFLSPLPYTEDLTQQTARLDPTGNIVYFLGNTNFYPVVKVHGPATNFVIENLNALDEQGNPLALSYDSTLPGAVGIASGHYAEFDFFRNTVYLDGNGANLKAGVDIVNSDWFPLVPGANTLNKTGASTGLIEMLWNNAYA